MLGYTLNTWSEKMKKHHILQKLQLVKNTLSSICLSYACSVASFLFYLPHLIMDFLIKITRIMSSQKSLPCVFTFWKKQCKPYGVPFPSFLFTPATKCDMHLNIGTELTVQPRNPFCCGLVIKLCPTLRDPMDQSMPSPPVFHCLPELGQIHVGSFSDTVQLSHPLSSPSPLAHTLSQHVCVRGNKY